MAYLLRYIIDIIICAIYSTYIYIENLYPYPYQIYIMQHVQRSMEIHETFSPNLCDEVRDHTVKSRLAVETWPDFPCFETLGHMGDFKDLFFEFYAKTKCDFNKTKQCSPPLEIWEG